VRERNAVRSMFLLSLSLIRLLPSWAVRDTNSTELGVFKDPHYLMCCHGVGHHDTTMVVDGMMESSLQMFLRKPTSRELHVQSHWWSLPLSPQSTSCSGADGSDLKVVVSMDQHDDNHEGVVEGFKDKDLYLGTGDPVEGLPESRLLGRHFMSKTQHRRRCRLCMRSETRGSAAYESKISLVCKQCDVFLHFECFEEYHSRALPISQWVGGA
jgi:hypothetical protein